MNIWEWADKHPIAMVLCALFVSVAVAAIAGSLGGKRRLR